MAEAWTGKPRLAASLIVVDDDAKEARVLMGRRSMDHVFLPGFHVFPGGALEPQDRSGLVLLHDRDAERMASAMGSGGNASRAHSLARAAIRELAEETGYDLAEGPRHLAPIGRAITPPGNVRRFDTWFFVAKAQDLLRVTNDTDRELGDVGWVQLPFDSGIKVHHITRTMMAVALDHVSGRQGQLPCIRTRNGVVVRESW